VKKKKKKIKGRENTKSRWLEFWDHKNGKRGAGGAGGGVGGTLFFKTTDKGKKGPGPIRRICGVGGGKFGKCFFTPLRGGGRGTGLSQAGPCLFLGGGRGGGGGPQTIGKEQWGLGFFWGREFDLN